MANRYSPRKDYAGQNAAWQGVNLSSGDIQMYSGVDGLKNMTIQDDRIYVSVSQDQHTILESGQQLPTDRYPALSGYFTDEATASRHFTGAGQYDAAGLAADLQQAPRYDPDAAMTAAMNGQNYSPTFNGNLACFTIDRDRLEAVYGTRDLNAAVGKCLSNDHLGPGGGNQGFNSDLTELYNNGCLQYDASRSRASQNIACQEYDTMLSRAESRTQDCLARQERTPSPEICARTGTEPVNPVQSQPFHSTEVQESHYYDGLHQRLHDPALFQSNTPGDYQYVQTVHGKFAEGVLGNEPGKRNLSDQRTVGGEDRRPTDDGGHLIGSRFHGSGNLENLEAQDRNLNRGSYKQMENRWAAAQDAGDQVFVHSESFRSNGSQRPDAFMGYAIYEHPDGTREWEAFSYQNESSATQQEWNDALDRFDPKGICMDNSLNPREYNPADYEAEFNSMDSLDEIQTQDGNLSMNQPTEQAPTEERDQTQAEGQPQAQTESQDQVQTEGQEQVQTEDQEQAQTEDQEQIQSEDLSMDQAAGQAPQEEQAQSEDLSMDQAAGQAPQEDQAQSEDLSMDQAAGQAPQEEQAQSEDLSMDQAAGQAPQEEQAQSEDLSMDQAAGQAPQEDQAQSEDLSMDQAAGQAPQEEQAQSEDLSMDQAAGQAPQEEQAQSEDLSMDQAAGEDASATQEQDSSGGEEQSSGQEEDQSQGYSY